MVTFFTIPKPFLGHIGVIQRNAIGSWKRLQPPCQVLMYGDEQGAREAAAGLGAEFVPEVAHNEFGTPLLSDVFAQVERRARSELLCYVNADIILLGDLIAAANRVSSWRRRFLMAGQRWDLDVREPLAFEAADWEASLRSRMHASGQLHPPAGSDYFLYSRGALGALPRFAVGRPAWDNWLIYRARALRIPVVDATSVATVIHQNHDYAHVRAATDAGWEGPEAERNRALMGARDRVFTLLDATHVLTATGVAPALDAAHLRRRVTSLSALLPATRPLFAAARAVRKVLRRS